MDKPWGMAAKVVVRDDQGRMLLVRRSNLCHSFAGYWEWPGGKVDPGENFADAAVREALEETGLQVQISGFATAFSFEMPKLHVLSVCFDCRTVGGTLQISEEHDASAWVAPADMGTYQLVDNHREPMLAYVQKPRAEHP